MAEAEKELKIKLDDDYKEFIKRFGGSYAGIAIHAFSNGSSMGNETIINLTNWCRESFEGDEFSPEINKSLIFSDDASGNPIAINANGEVVIYYHDSGDKEVLSRSFGSFVEENFAEW
ncbi:SMI1/KNR4 family protein [Lysinibacillus sp. JNUCC 51]|nr:SMI1/KNR4 family protein [Lysinibacillus sp. JNUCC-51]